MDRAAIRKRRRVTDINDIIASMGQTDLAAIEAGVIDVLRNVSRRPIEPTAAQELVADLGFDSLQVLEVASELEDRFGITIHTDDAARIRTVADVVHRIAELVGARPLS